MSFLNQLKSQAQALQSEKISQQTDHSASIRLTEAAAKTAWLYLVELAKQLNVIGPTGPKLSVVNKMPWPDMKLVDFKIDARKKMLNNQEIYDYIVMAWQIVPCDGPPVAGSVSANFPPDLDRIEARLSAGSVKHDRVEERHPEKKTLQAIRFDYLTEARGSVTISADHEAGQLGFRLANVQGFEVASTRYPAQLIQSRVLDELAKLIVGQASSFV